MGVVKVIRASDLRELRVMKYEMHAEFHAQMKQTLKILR